MVPMLSFVRSRHLKRQVATGQQLLKEKKKMRSKHQVKLLILRMMVASLRRSRPCLSKLMKLTKITMIKLKR
jgi:hypothetical protein